MWPSDMVAKLWCGKVEQVKGANVHVDVADWWINERDLAAKLANILILINIKTTSEKCVTL